MTSQTITQTSIPDWAQNYFTGDQGIFTQAQAQANRKYQPYQTADGTPIDRLAGFSGLTQKAMQDAYNMGPSAATQLAQVGAGTAAANALNTQYDPTKVDVNQLQIGSFTQPGAASAYMDPYMQNVVDIQKDEAQRRANIAGTDRNAQAVKAGAFGGSRQAIMDAEAQRNLAQQMGDIQAKGSSAAYNQAMQQFNAEQQLGLTAQTGNQQAGLDAQKLMEQSRQYGAGLGMEGLRTAITGANQLGALGQQEFMQGMDVNKLMSGYGAQQQAQQQAAMDTQYQDFLTQQQYPYQQIGFMTDVLGTGLRGASGVMGQAQNIYSAPPSTTSQLLGLGTAALGAYGAFGKAGGGTVGYAGGGSIGGYATGGIAGLNPMELDAATNKMSDQQMQGVMGLASVADLAKLQIAQKLAQNNQIRQAAMQAQAAQQPRPQMSIAEEALAELGVGSLDVPDEMFSGAEGGIVAFSKGRVIPGARASWEDDLEDLVKGGRPQGRSFGAETLDDIIKFFTANDALDKIKAREAKAEAEAGADAEAAAAAAPVTDRDPRTSDLPADNQNPLRAEVVSEETVAVETPAWDSGGQARQTAPSASGIATLPNGMNKTMEQLIAMRQRSPEEQAALTQYEGEQKAILQRSIDDETKDAQQVKTDREELGERGVEREKYIKGEEAKLSGAEEKSVNMALIEAGLAIMSGTSANPFENLGRGVVGLKSYKEDMAKIQTRKDKLRDEMFNLEEARYGDKKLSKAEDRENQKKVRTAKANMEKALSEIGRNNNVVFPEAVRKEAIAAFMSQETARYGAETTMAVARFKAQADRETANVTANKPPELIILAKELYEDARARGEPMTKTQAMEKAAEVKGTSAYNVAALKGDNAKQVALTKSLAAIDASFNLLIAVAKEGPEKQALITERDNRKQAAIRDSGVSGGAGTRPPNAVRLKPQP
jgi:hypothetical protein